MKSIGLLQAGRAAGGRIPLLGILVTGLLLATPATADIYRWTDSDCNVAYGSNPPPGVDAEAITMNVAPAAGPDSAEAGDAVEPGEAGLPATAPGVEPPADDGPPPLPAETCRQLADNLAILERNPTGVLEQGEDGEVRRLAPGERDQRLAEIRERLDRRCEV